jgi:hypothetical protein
MGSEVVIDAAFNKEAVTDTKVTDENLKNVKEYGYGFWLRFMSRYPVPLLTGKNAPFYFVSRLTNNIPNNNIDLGDRVLAIFQGQGGYYFVTNDETTKNGNIHKPIAYEDIESVWTYLYFSFS